MEALQQTVAKICGKLPLLDPQCLKLIVSRSLSFGIIIGSALVKVPQIINIVRAKKSNGIAASSFVLEIVGYSISVLYNWSNGYPISTWAENAFMWLQSMMIVFLIAHYDKKLNATFIATFVAFCAVFISTLIPGSAAALAVAPHLVLLQKASAGIFIASKLPQIVKIFKVLSTHQPCSPTSQT